MNRTTASVWLSSALSALLPLAPLSAFGQTPQAHPPLLVQALDSGKTFLFVDQVDQEPEDASQQEPQFRLALAADKPSEFWLGIAISELPDVAKQQLGLEAGLVVADVMEDSPAAKAELKKHDILIKADRTELKIPPDLLKVVDASQGKQIEIVIVRGGKDRTITVAPVKRAEAAKTETATRRVEVLVPNAEFHNEIKNLEDVLNKLKTKAGDGALSLWFPKPAVVAPQPAGKSGVAWMRDSQNDFPKDLRVQINKQGEQPTKIRVERGDQQWEVAEDKLSDLPDDVRPHVQKLLGRLLAPGLSAVASRVLRVQPGGKVEGEIKIAPVAPAPPAAPVAPQPPQAGVPPAKVAAPQIARLNAYRVESGGVEAKLDAIMKKLEELSKEVDELQTRNK